MKTIKKLTIVIAALMMLAILSQNSQAQNIGLSVGASLEQDVNLQLDYFNKNHLLSFEYSTENISKRFNISEISHNNKYNSSILIGYGYDIMQTNYINEPKEATIYIVPKIGWTNEKTVNNIILEKNFNYGVELKTIIETNVYFGLGLSKGGAGNISVGYKF